MTRLPNVGSDSNAWGTVLNAFLQVGHNADGSNNGIIPVFNPRDYGAVSDGTTDDATFCQDAINASTPGSIVFFPGNHAVGSTIQLLANRTYMGPVGYFNGFTFRQINGKNLPAVVASYDWYNNTATSGYPLRLYNISVDGNSANNTTSEGIIIMNYDSVIDGCSVTNAPGAGIVVSSISRNGTSVSNTCVEDRITNCKVVGAGTCGIRAYDTAGKLTDGYCEGNTVDTTTLDNILIDRAAGWQINRNHVYGGNTNGITAKNCFGTHIHGNYIDGFGYAGVSSTFYQGIYASILGGLATIISNNVATSSESGGSSHYQYMSVYGIDSSFAMQVSLYDNQVNGAGGVGNLSEAYVIDGSGGSASFTAYEWGNSAATVGQLYSLGTNITWGILQTQCPIATGQSATTPNPTTGGTITTAGVGVARVTPTSSETGIILQAGTVPGQKCTVINNSGSFTLQFAASGTSHVALGAGLTIPVNGKYDFTWDSVAALWY